jgi:hypothetical protein
MGYLNFNEIFSEIEKTYPDYYTYKPKGTFIDFVYDRVAFRGDNGKTRLEVYYGVPLNKVCFTKDEDYYYANLKAGIFIHNQKWEPIVKDVQDKDIQLIAAEADTASNDLAVDQAVYTIKPGMCFFAIEVMDYNSDNLGTFHDTTYVRSFGYDSLEISDIQSANRIEVVDSTQPLERDNLEIEPNPRRFYFLNQPLYFYWELYNLQINPATGFSDYTIEYSLEYAGEGKLSAAELVKWIFTNKSPFSGLSTKFSTLGTNRDESNFLKIEHSLKKEGPYTVTITVTDNYTKKTARNVVLVRLFDEKSKKE